jgi:hypothetical protein
MEPRSPARWGIAIERGRLRFDWGTLWICRLLDDVRFPLRVFLLRKLQAKSMRAEAPILRTRAPTWGERWLTISRAFCSSTIALPRPCGNCSWIGNILDTLEKTLSLVVDVVPLCTAIASATPRLQRDAPVACHLQLRWCTLSLPCGVHVDSA